jgi:hypothetical protein
MGQAGMTEYMMKRGFCARCGCDMGMMIDDDAPHPTCFECIDREMGRWVMLWRIVHYLAVGVVVAAMVAIVIQVLRSQL